MTSTTALLLSAAALAAFPAEAHGHRDRPTRRCADVGMHFDSRPTVRAERTVTVPAADARPLRVRPDQNGGVVVWGASGPDYTITFCHVAAGSSAADARALLARIGGKAQGGEVSVDGPAGGRWATFLLIAAPRGAELDLLSHNGPVSVDTLEGSVVARTENGPVSLERVNGSVQVTAQNGPISVEQGSGDYTLRADNGPISVELSDAHWDGRLEGRTENGPISVELPRGFASGLRLETSSWAPSSCAAAICDGARWRKGDGARVLEVGSGQPAVSLRTVNGPLSVEDADSD